VPDLALALATFTHCVLIQVSHHCPPAHTCAGGPPPLVVASFDECRQALPGRRPGTRPPTLCVTHRGTLRCKMQPDFSGQELRMLRSRGILFLLSLVVQRGTTWLLRGKYPEFSSIIRSCLSLASQSAHMLETTTQLRADHASILSLLGFCLNTQHLQFLCHRPAEPTWGRKM
jgi:hypothetical protein